MGLFKRKRKATTISEEIEKMAETTPVEFSAEDPTKPYFYFTLKAFGGGHQESSPVPEYLPDEIKEAIADNVESNGGHGYVEIAGHVECPDESEYIDGAMGIVHAHSRMEAAGTMMAFATLEPGILFSSLMNGVAADVIEIDEPIDSDEPSVEAQAIYEFKKSPRGELIVPFPSSDENGRFEYSGCFISFDAPRRTDSEVADMVVRAASVIKNAGILPSIMTSMHRDNMGVYGAFMDEGYGGSA